MIVDAGDLSPRRSIYVRFLRKFAEGFHARRIEGTTI
jgi:hypothetical protein